MVEIVQSGHTGLDLAIGVQKEKYLKSNSAQSTAVGHYRENNPKQKASAVSRKSGWMGKERITDRYKARVDDHTRQCGKERCGYVDMG